MARKQHRIAGTTTASEQIPAAQEPQQLQIIPIEIDLNIVAADVTKYQTPQGNLTVLSLISPVGISVSAKLSDENVAELVKNLTGTTVDTYKSMPGIIQ